MVHKYRGEGCEHGSSNENGAVCAIFDQLRGHDVRSRARQILYLTTDDTKRDYQLMGVFGMYHQAELGNERRRPDLHTLRVVAV